MQTLSNKLLNVNWHEKMITSSCSSVPKSTGIYIIGKVNYISKLEISREFVYVGQSVNLQRRLKEHGPQEESKYELRKFIKDNISCIKCWYCVVKKTDLSKTEKYLIKKLKPNFNIQHN